MTDASSRGPESHLSRISTCWPLLGDVTRFSLRYGPAIHKYILKLVGNPHDADEVAQDLLVRVLQRGFAHASQDRGRFRDYLKVAARNAAFTWLSRKHREEGAELDAEQVEAPAAPSSEADEAWVAEWRQCILARAWRDIEGEERREKGNWCHTVLRLTADHPDEDSSALAARVLPRNGLPMRADAFRKQLSRARRRFAEIVVREVVATVNQPTRDRVEEELSETGLLQYVRDYLPKDWDPSTLH